MARPSATSVFSGPWLPEQMAAGRNALDIAVQQLRAGFGAFITVPDRGSHYDPGIPLLTPLVAVLATIGLLAICAQPRRAENWLIGSWLIVVAVVGGALSVNVPEAPRYVTAAPALCLLIALGAVTAWRLILRTSPLRRMVGSAASLIVAALVAWNIGFYFLDYAPRNSNGWINTAVNNELARVVLERGEGTFVHFFGPPIIYAGNPIVRFLAPRFVGRDVQPGDVAWPTPRGWTPLFVFLPGRIAELDAVRSVYPGGATREHHWLPRRELLFITYELRDSHAASPSLPVGPW